MPSARGDIIDTCGCMNCCLCKGPVRCTMMGISFCVTKMHAILELLQYKQDVLSTVSYGRCARQLQSWLIHELMLCSSMLTWVTEQQFVCSVQGRLVLLYELLLCISTLCIPMLCTPMLAGPTDLYCQTARCDMHCLRCSAV